MITRNMALRMAVFIVCLSIIFPLCACEPHGYSGSDMDLYGVTHNSFPMTDYYETITPMDTDAYGRVLFEYRTSMALFYDTEDGFVRVDDQKQVCVRSVGQQMRPRIVPTDLLHEPRQQRRQLIAQFMLLRQPQQQNDDPIVELILEA